MNENLFQEWSEALTALRAKRSDEINARLQEKADFSPGDFFDIAAASLDEILDQWFGFEMRSAEGKPMDVDAVRSELDGIFEFEVDAISRDMDGVRTQARWDQNDVDVALNKFEASTQELKKKYVLKTSGGGAPAAQRKRIIDDEPIAAPRVAQASGSGGGSGMSVISMFLVGLVLGAGPSVYFWDQTKKQDKVNQEEKDKLIADQRALEDSMALLHERFDQLATGKIKSIPEIDREIEKLTRTLNAKREQAKDEYAKERERLVKKTPAGDRQDKALAALQEQHNLRLAEITAQESQAMEPLVKQKNTLQELRVR